MFKASTAFGTADILLPDPEKTDMTKWAAVACDQFTSEPEYWEDVKRITEGSDSAFDLILPEAYLESPDVDKMTEKIHAAMDDYLKRGVFREYKDAMIYTERTDSAGNLRCGIVGAVDLEEYDFTKGSTSQIRATEATVAERIPPRLKVRAGASLELPHIMLLIDDPEKTVIERITEKKDSLEKLYDFTLMKNGGSIRGYLMDPQTVAETDAALAALNRGGLLYAMGDGNHSLATAKEYYETLKRNDPHKDMSRHPARYALAEAVNLHSVALEFEAIHRIVTTADTQALLDSMISSLGLVPCNGNAELTWVSEGGEQGYNITKPLSSLTVGSVQEVIDKYLKEHGGTADYIHGEGSVRKLAARSGCAGILLPCMKKDRLFPAVIENGALPRKTFSMGHAEDKRYYVEARKITE
ncbi:MAG: DUF1015 domain-containing protein [Ruminococcus sp.]|nr:DUF1015 domain-containing protein [Ruminococcus sp.]